VKRLSIGVEILRYLPSGNLFSEISWICFFGFWSDEKISGDEVPHSRQKFSAHICLFRHERMKNGLGPHYPLIQTNTQTRSAFMVGTMQLCVRKMT